MKIAELEIMFLMVVSVVMLCGVIAVATGAIIAQLGALSE